MFTGDDAEARHVVLNTAAWHGRLLVINRDCAAESTGHGSPLPAPGPVLANYGLENLRFIEPVGIGDTIRVKLVVKQKIKKDKRPGKAGDKMTPTAEHKSQDGRYGIYQVKVTDQDGNFIALFEGQSCRVRGTLLAGE